MQTLAGIADECREPRLDVEVDVFEIELPDELAAFDFTLDLFHAALDRSEIVCADDLLRSEHLRVRKRALDVDERHPVVEENRRCIALDELRHRFGEAS